MLQCIFSGKAQEVYTLLSMEDSTSYKKVKLAVLTAYQLVLSAYQKCFRTSERRQGQTNIEFVLDLTMHFKYCLAALELLDFDGLCEVIILEQFKNVLPVRGATFINECKVSTVTEAAVVADEFELLHKSVFREQTLVRHEFGWRGRGSATPSAEQVSLGATASFKSVFKSV